MLPAVQVSACSYASRQNHGAAISDFGNFSLPLDIHVKTSIEHSELESSHWRERSTPGFRFHAAGGTSSNSQQAMVL
jgi:hypothetical protein